MLGTWLDWASTRSAGIAAGNIPFLEAIGGLPAFRTGLANIPRLRAAAIGAAVVTMAGSPAFAADMAVKAPVTAAPVPFFLYSDTQIAFTYQTRALSVFNPVFNTQPRSGVSIQHADAWAYGTNFVYLQGTKSLGNELSFGPCHDGSNLVNCSGDGMAEFYGLFRSTLSLRALSGANSLANGPIRDVSFYYGGDWGTQNVNFASNTRKIIAGGQLSFAVPGYLTIAVGALKEWNNEGYLGSVQDYRTQWAIETAYMQPLNFLGGIPLRISGFTNIHGPKGFDPYGAQTKTEFQSDNRLILDVGKLVADRANWLDVYVGYSFWYNKYGYDHAVHGPSIENNPYVGIAWHAM